MGSAVAQNVGDIFRDLNNSKYFRVWAFFWAVMVILWLVGLGMLSSTSLNLSDHPYFITYFAEEDPMSFPVFHFRLGSPRAINPNSVVCAWIGAPNTPLPIQQCQTPCFSPPCVANLSQCFAINGPLIQVAELLTPDDGIFSNGGFSSRIDCNFTVLPSESTGNELLAFEIERQDVSGPNSYASIWILPNNGTWIMLTKQIIDGVDYWLRNMMYHSAGFNTPQPPNVSLSSQTLFYAPVVILDTNTVPTMSTYDYFTGWQTIAAIGGWGFMLYIFHCLVMLLAGLFLENDSVFLNNAGRYTELKEESAKLTRS